MIRRLILLFFFAAFFFAFASAQSDYAINFNRSFTYLGNKYNLTLLKSAQYDYSFRLDNPAFTPATAEETSPILAAIKKLSGPVADTVKKLLDDDAMDSVSWNSKMNAVADTIKKTVDSASLAKMLEVENNLRTIRRSALATGGRTSPLYNYFKQLGAPAPILDSLKKLLVDTSGLANSNPPDTVFFAGFRTYFKSVHSFFPFSDSIANVNLAKEYTPHINALDSLRKMNSALNTENQSLNKFIEDTANKAILAGAIAELKKDTAALNKNIAGAMAINDGSTKPSSAPAAAKVKGKVTGGSKGLKQLDFAIKTLSYYPFEEEFCDAFRKVAGIPDTTTIENIVDTIQADNPDNADKTKHMGGFSLLLLLNDLNAYLASRDDIYGPDAGRLELTSTVIHVSSYNHIIASSGAKDTTGTDSYSENVTNTGAVSDDDIQQLAANIKWIKNNIDAYRKTFAGDSSVCAKKQLKSMNNFVARLDGLKKRKVKAKTIRHFICATQKRMNIMVKRAKVDKINTEFQKATSRNNTGFLSTCLLLPYLSVDTPKNLSVVDTTGKLNPLASDSGSVQNIQIEFKDGNIERIQVTLLFRNKTVIFSNNYPIPFSTESDYKELYRYRLYNRIKGGVYDSYGIYLGDFLQYIPYYRSKRRDFSPANGTLNIDPKHPTNILSKGRLADLFQAAVYTDFAGLFQPTNPNGLIQFEVNRKCPLWTKRFSGAKFEPKINLGFFSFVTPQITVSKIEKTNRDYPGTSYSYIENNTLQEIKYITPTALLNYSNTNINIKFNLVTFDFKQIKSEMYLNTNGSFGITGYADSIRTIDSGAIKTTGQVNVSELPYFTWNAEVAYEYQGDERFGFKVNGIVTRPWVTDANIYIVSNVQHFQQTGEVTENYGNSNWMFNLGFKAWVTPGNFLSKDGVAPNGGSIFLRTSFTQSFFERTQKFYQIQLGYSYNIFAVRSK